MAERIRKEKRKFSSFTPQEAMRWINLEQLTEWHLESGQLTPTPFFDERLRRLKQHFDLAGSEGAKDMLIEAICEEVLEHHPNLRVWKETPLSSDRLAGYVDYLIGRQQRYVEIPLLCVVEAKKDKFEEGLGQCLVEMDACRWNNRQQGLDIDVYGIVTNGTTWVFYKSTTIGETFETLPFSISNIESVMGALNYVFGKCEENLAQWKQAA